jgi:NAD(P)-dependent dehydrogenase (short-subunit alcohol dehydrogenase family)
VVADRDGAAAEEVAREVGAIAVACDVGREAEIGALVAQTRERYGRIDVFVSNAGVAEPGGVELPDASWQRAWDVNVMAHVWAARAVVDEMVARGSGYLVSVASAAGLLSMIGAAPYTATKHAVVGLAEWLAITYGDRGVRVSCVCPQFVQTAMLDAALTSAGGAGVFSVGAVLPLAPPRGRHLRAEEGCRSRSLDRGDAQAARLARRGAPQRRAALERRTEGGVQGVVLGLRHALGPDERIEVTEIAPPERTALVAPHRRRIGRPAREDHRVPPHPSSSTRRPHEALNGDRAHFAPGCANLGCARVSCAYARSSVSSTLASHEGRRPRALTAHDPRRRTAGGAHRRIGVGPRRHRADRDERRERDDEDGAPLAQRPRSRVARATRSTATMNAAVRRSTACFRAASESAAKPRRITTSSSARTRASSQASCWMFCTHSK